MACKFENICMAIYENDFKKVCMFYSESAQDCQLVKDIKNDNINSFVKSLLERETGIESDGPRNEEIVKCPRSLISNVSLTKNCPLRSCPFHSSKLSYHCFLIHYNIFFSDYESMPESLIFNGLGLNKQDYRRMLKLSIYNSRLHMLLKKYYMENQTRIKKYKTKDLKKIFNKNNEDFCSICGGKKSDKDCICLSNKSLRKERIKFNKKWRKVIRDKDPLNINDMTPKEFQMEYRKEMYKLRFIRSMLNSVSLNNTYLSSIPFGYIFRSFNNMFDDKPESCAENLGITPDLYKKASQLFMEN